MTEEPQSPRDTKEFVAGWQHIVEAHVVNDVAGALDKLAAGKRGENGALARHVTHALQLAASPAGSLQAAVRYLCDAADQPVEPERS